MDNNLPNITIDLVLDRNTTKDALKALLHSILFHRLFGTIKPQTIDILGVTMPGIQDEPTEVLIEEKVDAFWKAVESGANKRGQICVNMCEKRQKKTWFSMGEEEVVWEKWVINAEVRQPKTDRDRQTFNTTLCDTLNNALLTILSHTASERGRAVVPPITNNQGISPFPYHITVHVGGVEVG